jgi:hypothetical protein
MIYSVSNNENDIKNLLFQLREIYGDYAFISYIDGEYGIRVWVYNSLVYEFYSKMKSINKICVAIVFKNTKSFLNNLCDHIVEIDDIEFLSNTTEHIEDGDQNSMNHTENIVLKNTYFGNDGWNLSYIRGLHCPLYEQILLELNFSNIFYTLHVDGSRYINLHGCNNGIIYKINNENAVFHNINNNTCINSIQVCAKENHHERSNKIIIYLRNSNKWPHKNISPEIYNTLFDYCIFNNKICHVFQDLIPVVLPNHSNIIDSTKRFKNRPDFDYFINKSNECDIFLGEDSGPLYLLLHQNKNILKLCTSCIQYNNNVINNVNKNELINILNNFYK